MELRSFQIGQEESEWKSRFGQTLSAILRPLALAMPLYSRAIPLFKDCFVQYQLRETPGSGFSCQASQTADARIMYHVTYGRERVLDLL